MIFKSFALSILSTASRLTAKGKIRAHVARDRAYLNLGCQTNLVPDWLNVDVVVFPGATYMDAVARWPIADGALDAILCEHMIEHVSKADAAKVVQEAFRALRPGAKIRLITPNIESFAKMCLDPGGHDARTHIAFLAERGEPGSIVDATNRIFYGYGHRYIYSPGELGAMLRDAGFVDVTDSIPGKAIDPVFEGVEGHPKLLGFENNAIEAFAIEATKPLA